MKFGELSRFPIVFFAGAPCSFPVFCFIVVLFEFLATPDAEGKTYRSFCEKSLKYKSRHYEKFVLEYYRRHFNSLDEVKSAQNKWDISPDTEASMIKFLLAMQSDIFLRSDERILIIDTKYYGKTLHHNFDKATLHSGNVYQIFTYVKNTDVKNTGNVSGLLLYANTEEAISPDCSFVLGGKRIGAKTLDLNQDFSHISKSLDKIIEDFPDKKNDA